MLKYAIPSFVQTLLPFCTWRVRTADKRLYLTFDDGPHPEVTPWVLEQLRQYNARATFFCVGDNVRKFPEVADRIRAEGHVMGNHTMHHLNGWKVPLNTYLDNIEQAAQLIPGNLFRPPYGRISPRALKLVRRQYQIIMWDRLSRDYSPNLNVEESLQEMKQVNGGNILVFHDSVKSYGNLKNLLPELLEYYTRQGFKLCALNA